MNIKKFITTTEAMSITYDKFVTSKDAIRYIIEHHELKDFSKLLAIHFLTYGCNGFGAYIIYPSHKFLMDKFNVTISTISNAIKDLKNNNIISVAYDKGGRSFKRKNFYLLIPLIANTDVDKYLDNLKEFVSFDMEDVIRSINNYRTYIASNSDEVEDEDQE